MSGVQHVVVKEEDAGIRIDRWFQRHYPTIGFGKIQKLMRKGYIRLDGKRVKGAERIEEGMEIRVPPFGTDEHTPKPKHRMTLTENDIKEVRSWVLYKDEHMIVVNKPAGLPTQGGTGQTRHLDGLLDALKYDSENRPKLVHRLDKDTSGALVLGRTPRATGLLTKAFQTKHTDKRYWAIVIGCPKMREGRIKMKMDKLPGKHGERMVPTEEGKNSLTDYEVVDNAQKASAWLTLKPHTGRTHQLRLHCSEIGHPIVGDGKYGGKESYLSGEVSRKLHLHARFIDIPHPETHERIRIEAPLPPHMKATFNMLGFEVSDYEDPFDSDKE
ncbi:RluA family pseudouridine synthase [Temperatibacter marinus]|uniref:Pseudouridine synthase n=1 Tax=Temperatibacter marinus TaxID=1456591 RepID=A0AA52EBA6_9PROT|nr:RluA family pseudouridine synthase [Temperatibacter marinus]WND01575.1 RluA family pseudouridine synthase [Temperatibacter marinus]